jgi:hypothetical protein
MKQQYNFVIAKYWNTESNRLCVYCWGTQIQYGTKKEAERMAKWISEKTGEEFKPFYIDENLKT